MGRGVIAQDGLSVNEERFNKNSNGAGKKTRANLKTEPWRQTDRDTLSHRNSEEKGVFKDCKHKEENKTA